MMQAHNHDPREIAKFEASAQRWWDPHGEYKPLHVLNPVRLQYVEQRAELGGLRVLDVGCGGGILSEAMAKCGAIVTGIDLGEAGLQVAELHALDAGVPVTYTLESAEAHAQHSAAVYDVVTCMEMLEHVPNPAATLRALATLVRPGGHVFVSTLNRNLKSYVLGVLAAEYVLGLLPRGTHSYERFIKPSELAAWARAADLSVEDVSGLRYDPFVEKAWLAPFDIDVNYLMHLRKAGRLNEQ
jgi:2-polyprenyl-6-hydroxyphenyl methylase / 3-demethylubiquinone-9 3-methyltransferase